MSIKFSCVTLRHMSFGAGIVISVALQQIDDAPCTQAGAQGNHQNFQSINRACEKCNKVNPP